VKAGRVAKTSRTLLFASSAMKMLPAASTTALMGSLRNACPATPPSPLYPMPLLPATVAIKPVAGLYFRM
jgi:hypothetical protein